MSTAKHPLIIPVFIPHRGCPHQCIFCNQNIIAGADPGLPDEKEIQSQVDHYLRFKGNRTLVQLAFFGGNFLGLEPGERKKLLDTAGNLADKNRIDGIRFSTRPETITEQTLESLTDYPVTTIEIGVQSMNNRVLAMSKRGHTADDTRSAAALLKLHAIETGMQMMIGLPGDTDTIALKSAQAMADLSPSFVRIYPLIVLKKSLLHQWYTQGKYTPLTLDHSIQLAKQIYHLFTKKGIRVIRMGLQTSDLLEETDSMAAGPWHPAFGHLVLSDIFLDKALDLLRAAHLPKGKTLVNFLINPASESRLRGNKNRNLHHLKLCYPNLDIHVRKDNSLDPRDIRLTLRP